MEYKKTVLKRDFEITDVISVHYFEYTVDFSFPANCTTFGSWCTQIKMS